MKLKYELETVNMGNEIIMVPVGQSAEQVHGVIKLNEEGKEILDLLINSKNEEDVIKQLSEKYENDINSIRCYVKKIVTELRENGLIEE